MSDDDEDDDDLDEHETQVHMRRSRARREYQGEGTWNGGPDSEEGWDSDGESGHNYRSQEVYVDVRGGAGKSKSCKPYRKKAVLIQQHPAKKNNHLGSKLLNLFESLVLVAFVALLAWSTDFSAWVLPIHFTVAIAWHVAMINYPSALSTYTSPLVDAAVLSFQVYRWQSSYDTSQPAAKLTLLCLFTSISLVRATWLALKLSPCSIRY